MVNGGVPGHPGFFGGRSLDGVENTRVFDPEKNRKNCVHDHPMATQPLRKIDTTLLDGCEKIGILKSVAVTGGRKRSARSW